METGFDDGALGVIDDRISGHTAKELKASAVASEPGLHLLVGDDLGVLMAAVGQGHDKDPGGKHFAGKHINNGRPFAKIDLDGLPGLKVQDGGYLGVLGFKLDEEPADTGIAALETVVAYKG